jgi:hypothetical protein
VARDRVAEKAVAGAESGAGAGGEYRHHAQRIVAIASAIDVT